MDHEAETSPMPAITDAAETAGSVQVGPANPSTHLEIAASDVDGFLAGGADYQTRPVAVRAIRIGYPFTVIGAGELVSGDVGDYLVRFEDGSLAVFSDGELKARFAAKRPRARAPKSAVEAFDEAAVAAGATV